MGVGIELERAMEGLYTPHKVKSAVTGCPRNCAEAYVKDIGLVAVEGGWELYVGGAVGRDRAQGRPARHGRDQSDEAIRARARLPAVLPRDTREYLERTYAYLERVGLDAVRDGRARATSSELLERYRIAKAAADPDPWQERHDPVNPSSSRSSTPRLAVRPRSCR